MKIQLLSVSVDSWIRPYGDSLMKELNSIGHICTYIFDSKDVTSGDILVFLSYDRIFDQLYLNKHNLVIHESDLPKGRGMSPLTWQILNNINAIPICLLEASEKIDEGNIYYRDYLEFEGHELFDELKALQGKKTIELVLKFINEYPNIEPIEQFGQASYYTRRRPKDSKLDISQSIENQFNLLRCVDNNEYPAFFLHKGHKYILKISKENNTFE